MKTLYESILDNDEQVGKGIKNSIAQACVDFLSHSKFWNYCKYEVKGPELYVVGNKGYKAFQRFDMNMIGDEVIFDKSPEEHAVINKKLLEHAHFDNCDFTIDMMLGEIPSFISNCTNCNISLLQMSDDDVKDAAKFLKSTKNNTIIVHGIKTGGGKIEYSDYSMLNNTDFGNNEIILYDCAHLETIKGLKVDKLLLQTWNSYYNHSFNAGDVDEVDLVHLLQDNDIKSLGIIDNHVQYTNWLTKDKDEFKWKLLKTDMKRVPKINS